MFEYKNWQRVCCVLSSSDPCYLDIHLHTRFRRRNIAVSYITSESLETKTKADTNILEMRYSWRPPCSLAANSLRTSGALAAHSRRTRCVFASLANRQCAYYFFKCVFNTYVINKPVLSRYISNTIIYNSITVFATAVNIIYI